jgi:hypothetical protein
MKACWGSGGIAPCILVSHLIKKAKVNSHNMGNAFLVEFFSERLVFNSLELLV